MDGCIADLYGVENWLDYLMNSNPLPYEIAKPLVRLSVLARLLNRLQKKGYRLGIISWLAKCEDSVYDEAVKKAKVNWLRKHLPSVEFDEVHIVKYGTCKSTFLKNENDILFDDEENNRENWGRCAYDEKSIFNILKQLQFLIRGEKNERIKVFGYNRKGNYIFYF